MYLPPVGAWDFPSAAPEAPGLADTVVAGFEACEAAEGTPAGVTGLEAGVTTGLEACATTGLEAVVE